MFEFSPVVSNRAVGNEWVCAIQAALKLQDLSADSIPQQGIQRCK